MMMFTKTRAAVLAAAVAVSLVATAPAEAASKKGKATGTITVFLPVGETTLCDFVRITAVSLSSDGGVTNTNAKIVKKKSRSNIIDRATNTWPKDALGNDNKKAYCDITWRAKGMAKGNYAITYTLQTLNADVKDIAAGNFWFVGAKATTSTTLYPTLATSPKYVVVSSDTSAVPGVLVFKTATTVKIKKSGTKSIKKFALSLNTGAMGG